MPAWPRARFGVSQQADDCRSGLFVAASHRPSFARTRRRLPIAAYAIPTFAEDRSMYSKSASRTLSFEKVEDRMCPTILIGLGSNGDLNVSGDTAGPIAITALDADSYQVTEGATPVA